MSNRLSTELGILVSVFPFLVYNLISSLTPLYSSKLALKNLRLAVGLDVPDDIAPVIAKQGLEPSKKPANVVFALHQQKQRDKKLEHQTIKRFGNEDVDADSTKLNIQQLRNEMTSRLKEHYGKLAWLFFFAVL
jgi:hypothetical protein